LQVTKEWFASFMPAGFEPKHVYTAGTVDQGGNVANAITALKVPLILCAAHRLNTAVSWGIGVSGSTTTCRNMEFRQVLSAAAALVGVFSHAAGNNDLLYMLQLEELRTLQSELEDVAATSNEARRLRPDGIAFGGGGGGGGGAIAAADDDDYEYLVCTSDDEIDADVDVAAPLPAAAAGAAAAAVNAPSAAPLRTRALNMVSRNDTRWLGNQRMLKRLVQLQGPIGRFFQRPQVLRLVTVVCAGQ
jgi:hypothetical protein